MADQDDKQNAPNPLAEELASPSVPEKAAEVPVPLSPDSQNLLKEFDQANLEVEAMPESSELQERRRKTKNRLKELAEVEGTETDQDASNFENEEGGLMDLLKEANLSKRQLGFCCGGVLVLLLLAGMIYGGFKAWNVWQARPHDTETVVEDSTEIIDESPVSSAPDSSVTAGVLLGQSSSTEGSTVAGEDLGTAASSENELAQIIVDFSKIYEAMQVDVNQLLDQSTDRRTTLTEYEQQLNYLLYVAKQNQKILTNESEALIDQFEALEDQRSAYEERFFDKLRNLDAYASTAAFNAFVADAQAIVNLRAHYQARQKLLGYYEQAIESMSARVQDIQLNEQALVEGIQVVDIEGSDINLIIQESDL